jgi:NADP-dependent 3-hydroxy acid dehydrogenase YdfG
MSNIEGKVVAITGASSGIGEATARHLAKLGAKVVLGARRTDRLEKIVAEIRAQGGTAESQPLDVPTARLSRRSCNSPRRLSARSTSSSTTPG